MELINTYDETLAHYALKLTHTEDELNYILRDLKEMEFLLAEGWVGTAGEAVTERLREFRREVLAPRRDIEEIRADLSRMGAVIQEEIRSLEAQAAAAAAAYYG